jgi:hypothetical protein
VVGSPGWAGPRAHERPKLSSVGWAGGWTLTGSHLLRSNYPILIMFIDVVRRTVPSVVAQCLECPSVDGVSMLCRIYGHRGR